MELIFCSDNINDFAEKDETGERYNLHQDLKGEFPVGVKVKYYRFLIDLIKTEFRIPIKKSVYDMMKEQLSDLSRSSKALEQADLTPEIDPPPVVRFWQWKGVGHEQGTVYSGANRHHAL